MTSSIDEVREQVRSRYAAAAAGGGAGTGGRLRRQRLLLGRLLLHRAKRWIRTRPVFGSGLYGADEQGELPQQALLASLGCGNPVAVADLRAGETVLDLGSGGGIDVLLSARRVGPDGFAYGVDMTEEMLHAGPGQCGQGRRHATSSSARAPSSSCRYRTRRSMWSSPTA